MPIQLKEIAPRGKYPSHILLAVLMLGLVAVLSVSWEARAEQVTLAWDPNTESDLAGYKIYLGTASNTYNSVIDVGNKTSFTVTNLNRGTTYFFSVTAYNIQGNESDYSNEVDKNVVRQYQLNVGKRGSGSGTVLGPGLDCGADCQAVYDEGSQVSLNVNPDAGSIFTGWSGDDCSGLGECVLSMWSDKTLTAGLRDQATSVAKKNRSLRVAGDSPAPTGRMKMSGIPAGDESSSYYVITRRADGRGTTSSPENPATREALLRFKYTSN